MVLFLCACPDRIVTSVVVLLLLALVRAAIVLGKRSTSLLRRSPGEEDEPAECTLLAHPSSC